MTPMIPRTRDAAPGSLQQSSFSLKKYFCVGALSLASFAGASFAVPRRQSQDANAKPSPAPAQQAQSANQQASPAPQAGSQPSANPLKKAVDDKKVITEDDLTRPRKKISLSDLDGEENNPTCDLSCEEQLRREFGYSPGREAEFQTFLTLTRHEIADDKAWNSRLREALQAAAGYCDMQRQKEAILGKGNAPQYVRDNVNERFGSKERAFVLQYREASGYMNQQIQTVRRYSPFRAAVMEYQWSEAAGRVCGGYALPQ
jgi:hypothetical protein